MLPARVATIAEAEAVAAAAGHEMPHSVTSALCALPAPCRAQWLGVLRMLGHDIAVGPMLVPATGLPPDGEHADVLCHKSLAQQLPHRVWCRSYNGRPRRSGCRR